jgi:ABC-2 type transport system ATP-binding protein
LWETIERRVAAGTTVLLTTQYLDEADRLADRIAVIDRGRLLAEGTSDELKDRFGGERLDLTLENRDQAEAATAALQPIVTDGPSVLPSGALCFPVERRQGTIAAAVRRLDEAGIGIDDVAMHRPTLDDVFLGLTGRAASEAEDGAEPDGEAG